MASGPWDLPRHGPVGSAPPPSEDHGWDDDAHISAAVAVFALLDGGDRVVFEFDLDTAAGSCRIDAGMLRIALFNLLENALDACVENHSVREGRIAFSVRRDRGRVIFEVADNGIGMDSETIDNLFTLFFSSKGEKGTGMGLFIADKIARDLPGTPPYQREVAQALTHSLDRAVLAYLEHLWRQRETLAAVHPWLIDAYQELEPSAKP